MDTKRGERIRKMLAFLERSIGHSSDFVGSKIKEQAKRRYADPGGIKKPSV